MSQSRPDEYQPGLFPVHFIDFQFLVAVVFLVQAVEAVVLHFCVQPAFVVKDLQAFPADEYSLRIEAHPDPSLSG